LEQIEEFEGDSLLSALCSLLFDLCALLSAFCSLISCSLISALCSVLSAPLFSQHCTLRSLSWCRTPTRDRTIAWFVPLTACSVNALPIFICYCGDSVIMSLCYVCFILLAAFSGHFKRFTRSFIVSGSKHHSTFSQKPSSGLY
jgi:hypothetical protein